MAATRWHSPLVVSLPADDTLLLRDRSWLPSDKFSSSKIELSDIMLLDLIDDRPAVPPGVLTSTEACGFAACEASLVNLTAVGGGGGSFLPACV